MIATMGALSKGKGLPAWAIVFWIAPACILCRAQTMPATVGETLSGHRVILAQSVRGHASLLIASFSKEAGSSADEWAKDARADSALGGLAIYQAAMLERAPGFIRSMIKSSLRKQTPAAAQDTFFVITEDEPLWRSYFGVSTDKDPYVVLIDAAGQVRWHGHGAAADLEPLVKAALK
jgi:hypothetical protein